MLTLVRITKEFLLAEEERVHTRMMAMVRDALANEPDGGADVIAELEKAHEAIVKRIQNNPENRPTVERK